MKIFKISILVNIGISFLIACVALYAGFQHNPQGEFHDTSTGVINYGHSSLLFLSWFVFIFILGAIIIALCWGLNKIIQRIRLAWTK